MSLNTPRDAATIILLRPSQPDHEDPFEVFMVKRSAKSSFMASAYVYPGGALDQADQDPALEAHVDPTILEALKGRDDVAQDAQRALGLYMAGVRETFEEAGLLLASAQDAPSAYLALDDAPTNARFEAHRAKLRSGELSLLALAQQESLRLRLDELAYFSRWITPGFEKKRFDARFFIAAAPPHQAHSHDHEETVDSQWCSPRQAIDAYAQGQLYLAPPTLVTLAQLEQFEHIDAVFAHCRQHRPAPILPHLLTVHDQPTLLLPTDPEHPDQLRGEAVTGYTCPWRRVVMANTTPGRDQLIL